MARQNKYQYVKVLQGMFEGKWADIIFCDARYNEHTREEHEQFRADYRSYRENDPRPYRVIQRRVPANELIHA